LARGVDLAALLRVDRLPRPEGRRLRPAGPRSGGDRGLVDPAGGSPGRRFPGSTPGKTCPARAGLARRLRPLDGTEPDLDGERREDVGGPGARCHLSRCVRTGRLLARPGLDPPRRRRGRGGDRLHRGDRPTLAPASFVVPGGEPDRSVPCQRPGTTFLPAALLERGRGADCDWPPTGASARDPIGVGALARSRRGGAPGAGPDRLLHALAGRHRRCRYRPRRLRRIRARPTLAAADAARCGAGRSGPDCRRNRPRRAPARSRRRDRGTPGRPAAADRDRRLPRRRRRPGGAGAARPGRKCRGAAR
jgi:hypothetical protein